MMGTKKHRQEPPPSPPSLYSSSPLESKRLVLRRKAVRADSLLTILDLPDSRLEIIQGQVGDRVLQVVEIHLAGLTMIDAERRRGSKLLGARVVRFWTWNFFEQFHDLAKDTKPKWPLRSG